MKRGGKIALMAGGAALALGIGTVLCAFPTVGSVRNPLFQGVGQLELWVEKKLQLFQSIQSLEEENAQLRQQVAQFSLQQGKTAQLEEENDRLRQLLGLELEDHFVPHPVEITGWEEDNWRAQLILYCQGDWTAPEGAAVITAEGKLVGLVEESNPGWAVVDTVIDPEFVLSVRTQGGSLLLAQGSLEGMAENWFDLTYLRQEEDAACGEAVYTAGGENCPSGLLVGTVETVFLSPGALDWRAQLRPAVEWEELDYVFVLEQ